MSATLGFKYFPQQNWRPSGVNIEFDPSQANTAVQNQRALIIGQILSAGTTPANVPVQAISQAQVNGLCGANSMAAIKYAAYRKQDPFGEVWIGPLSDNGGGTANVQTLTFSGSASAAGTMALYIEGVPVPFAVNSGDTATTQATNCAAAINAMVGICATAAAVGAVVTLTANHKGLANADQDVRLNFVGVSNGEVTPTGCSLTVATGTAGTLNPVLTTLLTNCGVRTFDYIDCPYTDATSLNAISTFLNDQAGRWAAENMLYGHCFAAYGGTVSARVTFGLTRNDQHASILGYSNGASGSPTPAWVEASDWTAAHVVRLRVNPAQGVSSQNLNMQPPPAAAQDTPGQRNTLLFSGMATAYFDVTGQGHIDRSITTYQLNPSGQPDNSYLSTNLLFQAMYAARYIAAQLTSQFIAAGKILVSNGTPISPGSPACTPNTILGSVMAIYAYLSSIFIVQNPQTFARNAYAAVGTKGQVLLYLPLDFADQVINIAILAQFVQST